eukprot:Gb_40774 [translate_table: standard]
MLAPIFLGSHILAWPGGYALDIDGAQWLRWPTKSSKVVGTYAMVSSCYSDHCKLDAKLGLALWALAPGWNHVSALPNSTAGLRVIPLYLPVFQDLSPNQFERLLLYSPPRSIVNWGWALCQDKSESLTPSLQIRQWVPILWFTRPNLTTFCIKRQASSSPKAVIMVSVDHDDPISVKFKIAATVLPPHGPIDELSQPHQIEVVVEPESFCAVLCLPCCPRCFDDNCCYDE